MRRKAICVSIVFFVQLFLTGCWDMREIENNRYMHALGVDYEHNNVVIYAQLIPFTNIAKQEGGGQGDTGAIWIGKAVGKTFDIATDNLYKTAQQRYSWGHVAAIVFSENALKNKKVIENVVDVLERYNEVRKTIWVMGTKEKLGDFLIARPAMNRSVVYSLLSDPDDAYLQYSIVKPITIREFVISMRESGATTILPYLAISKETWKEDRKKHEILMLDGVGVLQQGEFKGYIPRTKLQGIRWTQPKTSRTTLYIFDGEEPVASIVMEKPKIQITPQVAAGKVAFDVNIDVKGIIIEMGKTLSQAELQKKAEERIENEIRKVFREGLKLKADVLQLSSALYRENPRVWHELAKNNELPLSDASLQSLNVKVWIYSSGKAKEKYRGVEK